MGEAFPQVVGHRGLTQQLERQLLASPGGLQLELDFLDGVLADDQIDRTIGTDQEQSRGLRAPCQEGEQIDGRRVTPVQVLEDHDQWRFRRQRLDRFGDLAQHPLLRGAQQLPLQRVAVGGTEEPWHLHEPGGRMLPQEGDQPVAPSLAAEPAEGVEQRQIWFLSPVRLDALALSDPDARVGGDALEKGLDHARLADARLAGHEDDLTHAAPRRIEPCLELVQDGLPAHEVGRAAIAGAAAEGGGRRRRPRRLISSRSAGRRR